MTDAIIDPEIVDIPSELPEEEEIEMPADEDTAPVEGD